MRLLDAVLLPGCIVFASTSESLGARVLRREEMKVPAGRSLRSDTAAGGGEEERSYRFLDFFSSCFGRSAPALKPSLKIAETEKRVVRLTQKTNNALEKRNAAWEELTKSYKEITNSWRNSETAVESFVGTRAYTEIISNVVKASEPLPRNHEIRAAEFYLKNTSQDNLMKMIDGALASKNRQIKGHGENLLVGIAMESFRHKVEVGELRVKYSKVFEEAQKRLQKSQGEKASPK